MTSTIPLTAEQVAACAQKAYRAGTYEEQNEILRGIFRAECLQAERSAKQEEERESADATD